MEPQPNPNVRAAALDELVSELLVCASAINHLITGMIEWETMHGSPAEAPPLTQIAHTLLSSVAGDRLHQSKRDLKMAAAIAREIAAGVQEDIYVVNPEAFPDAHLN